MSQADIETLRTGYEAFSRGDRESLFAAAHPDFELKAPLAFASADHVRDRAPKVVKAAETLDFKTLVPVAGGLFDYKVFGPGTVIDAVQCSPCAS